MHNFLVKRILHGRTTYPLIHNGIETKLRDNRTEGTAFAAEKQNLRRLEVCQRQPSGIETAKKPTLNFRIHKTSTELITTLDIVTYTRALWQRDTTRPLSAAVRRALKLNRGLYHRVGSYASVEGTAILSLSKCVNFSTLRN